MNRVELLLFVLCVCVRALTLDQAKRLLKVEDDANLRRFLRPLAAAGLVRVLDVLAKPVPGMPGPLLSWPGPSEPGRWAGLGRGLEATDLGERFLEVLRLARNRWAGVSARLIPCVVATRKAGLLYGVKRTGDRKQIPKPTHDLGLAEVLLRYASVEPVQIEHWYGEDFADLRLGEKRLDAVILAASETRGRRYLECVGGDYTAQTLLTIHRECRARRIAYELW